jgi:hypothetical protein
LPPIPLVQSKWDSSVNISANEQPRIALDAADDVDADALSPVKYKGKEGVETDGRISSW